MDPKAPGVDSRSPVDANHIRKLFSVASLAGFDFNAQLTAAKKTATEITGERNSPVVIGGTTVEVYSDFEGAQFRFVCKDLDQILPHYSRYNAELARLLALLEDLQLFRPRRYSFTN